MLGVKGEIRFIAVMPIVLVLMLGTLSIPGAYSAVQAAIDAPSEVDTATKAHVQQAYGKLPLHFIKNDGQVDEKVKYYERGAGHTMFFTEEGVYLSLRKGDETATVKLTPVGGRKHPEIIAEDVLPGKANYFIGNDKSKWRTNIPTYRAVRYKDVYENIDIKYYGNNRQLEYDVIVNPGADPAVVKFNYEGTAGLKLTEAGELLVEVGGGNLIHRKPYIYQEIEGKRVEIAGVFKLYDKTSYGFEVASYDKNYPVPPENTVLIVIVDFLLSPKTENA